MSVPFVILALLTIGGATATMTLRKLVHCALALAICLIGLAGLYLDLGAQFVGLAQILVYVGAVVILIVFAILLTRSDDLPLSRGKQRAAGMFVATAVFAVLAWAVLGRNLGIGSLSIQHDAPIQQIGSALMSNYVLPLEIVGLLLTAALIGAVVIAMEEKQSAQ